MRILTIALGAFAALAVPGTAFLQGPGLQIIPESGTIGGCNFVTGDFGFDCIPLYLSYLIRLAFGLAGGFALFELIKGGYEYAMSGVPAFEKDPSAAKKRITHAILGFSVVVLAYLIIDTIVSAVFAGI